MAQGTFARLHLDFRPIVCHLRHGLVLKPAAHLRGPLNWPLRIMLGLLSLALLFPPLILLADTVPGWALSLVGGMR
tara:strand:- start:352 stop:579 length:228 start_codon:yes stop_codon:yes gene_type:complete